MRDIDVRQAVWRQLAAAHAGDANTRLVQEMGVWSGAVRIDIAVINGELSGYELKSDRDTLQRLPYQVEIYGKVFDKLSLVVGAKHAEKAARQIPTWWGLIVATADDGAIGLQAIRAPQKNPAQDAYVVAEMLNREEALAVLERFGLAKGWRTKRIRALHQRLAAELNFADLALEVRNVLKGRPIEWLGKQTACQLDVSVNS